MDRPRAEQSKNGVDQLSHTITKLIAFKSSGVTKFGYFEQSFTFAGGLKIINLEYSLCACPPPADRLVVPFEGERVLLA